MTSIKNLSSAIAMIVSMLSLSVYAQSPNLDVNHFSTSGISFNYPVGYSVTDESTAEAQRFTLTRKGSSVQLTIVATRRMVLLDEMPAAIQNFKEPIIKNVGTTLGPVNSQRRTPIQSQLGLKNAEGIRLQSSSRNRKRTGEVIWLRWNSRLVALSFVRSDAHEAVESPLWETVRSSLKVEPPLIGGQTAGVGPNKGAIMGGVLNRKALSLPKPEYPAIARAVHASGTVVVQVLINEEGYVVSAKAVSGHPLLQAVSVTAAREARFSPTFLSGEPVKVTGMIEYNFVAQ